MNVYRFKKKLHRWYIDLPDYKDSSDDLQFVNTGDLLNHLLEGDEDTLVLYISVYPIGGTVTLSKDISSASGIYWEMFHTKESQPTKIDVISIIYFVFGAVFPSNIYIKKLSNEEFKRFNIGFTTGTYVDEGSV